MDTGKIVKSLNKLSEEERIFRNKERWKSYELKRKTDPKLIEQTKLQKKKYHEKNKEKRKIYDKQYSERNKVAKILFEFANQI
jgi:hypothetical protein